MICFQLTLGLMKIFGSNIGGNSDIGKGKDQEKSEESSPAFA
jgi:hypothetical protein